MTSHPETRADGRNVQRSMSDPYSKRCSEQTIRYVLFLKKLCNITVLCLTGGKKNNCSSCSGCGDIERYTDPVKMSAQESRCGLHVVKLTAVDIPGAGLSDPFEAHAIPALRWWLLCRGIAAPQSSKVAELCNCRISFFISLVQALFALGWNFLRGEAKRLPNIKEDIWMYLHLEIAGYKLANEA